MPRNPAVAGKFYPAETLTLKSEIQKYLKSDTPKKKSIGLMAPHAGYVFSGDLAGALFSISEIPDTVILIGPNHTGLGEAASIASPQPWKMPWGEVPTNTVLSELIKTGAPFLKECDQAHRYEHSIEVQLPFLYFINNRFSFVAITILGHNYEISEKLGKAIARGIHAYEKPVLIVASSDMSHYVPGYRAKEMDQPALSKILEIDPRGLFDVVQSNSITMCGVMPTITMLVASKSMGSTKGELVGYKNSGDVNGDSENVVSYAGVRIE
ncbi:MAG: AmmeMemoRadiSam system protein B [Nitrospinota bacterium]